MKYKLEELTKEKVNKYFEKNTSMDVITKTGTLYHIIKYSKGYACYSGYCYNPRNLTKTMKKVFC